MSELMPIGSECEILFAPSRTSTRVEWALWRYRVVAHDLIREGWWDKGGVPAERLEPVACERVQAVQARFTDDGGFEWVKPEQFDRLTVGRVSPLPLAEAVAQQKWAASEDGEK